MGNLQYLKNRFCRHPNNPTNLNLQIHTTPNTIRTMIQSADIINTIIITLIINTTSSLTLIRRIFQLAKNSVYPKIFTLIHNLTTYTILRNNHLKSDKNTFAMAKYQPRYLKSQSNRRTSIHPHVKVKIPKKRQQQLSHKK